VDGWIKSVMMPEVATNAQRNPVLYIIPHMSIVALREEVMRWPGRFLTDFA